MGSNAREASWYRRINGRYWTLAGSGLSKTKARERAQAERRAGQFARVMPTPAGEVERFRMGRGEHYDVWVSRKPEKKQKRR